MYAIRSYYGIVDPEDLAPLALWDAISIARAAKGTANADFELSGVEIDSRDVRPGDLFFALKGETTDGHRFVEMAFEKGAAAAIVDRRITSYNVCYTKLLR